jgi:prefoldin subunit 5
MKEESQKALEILKDYQNKSNKDLIFAMDYIKKDFDLTKESIIKLTHHLDKLEKSYDQLLKEYNNRNNITNQ